MRAYCCNAAAACNEIQRLLRINRQKTMLHSSTIGQFNWTIGRIDNGGIVSLHRRGRFSRSRSWDRAQPTQAKRYASNKNLHNRPGSPDRG